MVMKENELGGNLLDLGNVLQFPSTYKEIPSLVIEKEIISFGGYLLLCNHSIILSHGN